MAADRTPPHDEQSEQALLGAMLLNKTALLGASITVDATAFYIPRNALVFKSMQDLVSTDQPVDTITVRDRLGSAGLLEKAGGESYLLDLMGATTVTTNWHSHADIIKRKATLRALIETGTRIVSSAYDDPRDLSVLVAQAETAISAAHSTYDATGGLSFGQLLPDFEDYVLSRSDGKSLPGFSWGIPMMDEITMGLSPGSVTVLAARPSVGKSSLAENLALHNADLGIPVFIAELEQARTKVVTRMACSRQCLSGTDLQKGRLTKEQTEDLITKTRELANIPLHIDDTPSLHYRKIADRARRYFQAWPFGLLIVDHLNLVSYDGDNRNQGLGDASGHFKSIAKKDNLAVLILSQLNRSVEKDGGRRPNLADLRDSGEVEQNADVVAFIHRENSLASIGGIINPPTHTAIIAKHRDGEANVDVPLAFVPEWTRFFGVTT